MIQPTIPVLLIAWIPGSPYAVGVDGRRAGGNGSKCGREKSPTVRWASCAKVASLFNANAVRKQQHESAKSQTLVADSHCVDAHARVCSATALLLPRRRRSFALLGRGDAN